MLPNRSFLHLTLPRYTLLLKLKFRLCFQMIDSWDSATKLLASAFSDIDVHRGDGESEIKSDSGIIFSHQDHHQEREERLSNAE